LLLLHVAQLALLILLGVFASVGEQGRGQRTGGATALGITTTGHVGLGDRLRFAGALVGTRIDQHHFQRGVLKYPVEAFGVDKTQLSANQRGSRWTRPARSAWC
jgi:hypothetical protein